ncbi:MAG: YggS family pyridoxal phosphate enzyme [Actinomycetota bacterium]|nr:YggS family pyridoxal phosphate enzyme [Actinomycetota bacterium]
MTVAAAEVADALELVRARISAVGDAGRVRVVAVTKGFGPDAPAAAAAAGLSDLGENYAQELLSKSVSAPEPTRWHFLGAPQRNKIAALAPVVHLWQAVDRLAVVERLAAAAPGARLLVQVNFTGGAGRAGCAPAEAPALVDAARSGGLDVLGLMTVAPAGEPEVARRVFDDLAGLGRSLGVAELSMGMSDDYEAAVAAGSTMVRLGRALFGARPGGARRRG